MVRIKARPMQACLVLFSDQWYQLLVSSSSQKVKSVQRRTVRESLLGRQDFSQIMKDGKWGSTERSIKYEAQE